MNLRTVSLMCIGAMLLAACTDETVASKSTSVAAAEVAESTESTSTTLEEQVVTTVAEPTATIEETTTTTEPIQAIVAYESALLMLSDLPDGWSETTGDDDDEEGETDSCLTFIDDDDDDDGIDNPTAEASFSGGAVVVDHGISLLESNEAVSERIETLRARIDECNPFTDEDGTTFTFAPLNIENRLDEMFAISGTLENGSLIAALRIAVIRKGNVAMVLSVAGVPTVDDDQFIELLDLAVARLDGV